MIYAGGGGGVGSVGGGSTLEKSKPQPVWYVQLVACVCIYYSISFLVQLKFRGVFRKVDFAKGGSVLNGGYSV